MCTIDPLDSDLIINEQCMHLTSYYRLELVNNVILKSEFKKIIALKMEQENQMMDVQSNGFLKEMKNIEIEEHLNKVLTKSKSVSFNEVIESRHVVRMILACIFTNFNATYIEKQIPYITN